MNHRSTHPVCPAFLLGRPRTQPGFTLVEMATVLVIIGLLLGMAFKGRDLIDGARVKSIYAGSQKIQSAMQVFFERYQSWPGDGCNTAATSPAQCQGATGHDRNGLIDSNVEAAAFWDMLITQTGMLAAPDQTLPGSARWAVALGAAGQGGTDANASWLVANALGDLAVDARYVCALDQQFDDGQAATGQIRSGADKTAPGYAADTDCWKNSGLAALAIRILP